MKIVSWNVNSVRARILNILNYLKNSKPDILMMQEIKTEEKSFPFNDFKNLGYQSYVFGQKSYNGVAFLSRKKIDKINIAFFKDKLNQSRIIVGDIKNKSNTFKLINIYVPNGNPINTEKYDYKKNWFKSFIKEVKKTLSENKNIIIGGDFNVIPEKIDVYDHAKYENDALFKLEIRKKFRELINLGFHDIYTWLKTLEDKSLKDFYDEKSVMINFKYEQDTLDLKRDAFKRYGDTVSGIVKCIQRSSGGHQRFHRKAVTV